MAQLALGLQIRGMEDEMRAQLLDRHARGVQPTKADLLVLEWARETVQNAQSCVGAQKLWAGTVHIHPNAKTGAHHHGRSKA